MLENILNKNDIDNKNILNIINGKSDDIDINELYYIISVKPKLIRYIKEPSEELQIIALIKDPNIYDLINNPSMNVTRMYLEYSLERKSIIINIISSICLMCLSSCGIIRKVICNKN